MKLFLSGALLLLLFPVASAQESSSPGQGAPNVFSGTGFRTPGQRPKTTKKWDVLGSRQSDGKEEQKARLPYMEEDCRLK